MACCRRNNRSYLLFYASVIFTVVLIFLFYQHFSKLYWNNYLPSFFNQLIYSTDDCDDSCNNINQLFVSHPWIQDPTCQDFTVKFAKEKSRPKWALTSFPGSGVTWTRQLIEGVTGIYTGTVYGESEPPIVSTGYYGNQADLDCECTILIKDHDATESGTLDHYLHQTRNVSFNERKKKEYQNRGILLLRNPIDVLFTSVHYMKTLDQIGTVSPDALHGPQWDEYVNYVAFAWADHAKRWISTIQNGTVIFYEQLLRGDTQNELKRLLNAIHFTDSIDSGVDPERMRCTLEHKNRTDRKRRKKPTVPLQEKQHSKFKSSIDQVQLYLKNKGWPSLPVHLYNN